MPPIPAKSQSHYDDTIRYKNNVIRLNTHKGYDYIKKMQTLKDRSDTDYSAGDFTYDEYLNKQQTY